MPTTHLPGIERLSETVVRVLGQNPGLVTLQGTNTYIVGQQNPYTLIDTGEGREDYIPILERALRELAKPINSNEPDVSDIIISHWHPDHILGLTSVLQLLRRLWNERNSDSTVQFTPPRIHKFPLQPDTSDGSIDNVLSQLSPGSFILNPNGSPLHDLYDSQSLPLAGRALDGSELSLLVLHTPGHTSDSICLYHHHDQALFTADTILGEGTAVFEDLTTYFSSLHKLTHFHRAQYDSPDQSTHVKILYPGHGPVVPDAYELISKYIQHRLERETQIIEVLKLRPPPNSSEEDPDPAPNNAWTTWTIVSKIYSAYPLSLWLHAAKGVVLHLRKLEDEGRVRKLGGEGVNMKWELIEVLHEFNHSREGLGIHF